MDEEGESEIGSTIGVLVAQDGSGVGNPHVSASNSFGIQGDKWADFSTVNFNQAPTTQDTSALIEDPFNDDRNLVPVASQKGASSAPSTIDTASPNSLGSLGQVVASTPAGGKINMGQPNKLKRTRSYNSIETSGNRLDKHDDKAGILFRSNQGAEGIWKPLKKKQDQGKLMSSTSTLPSSNTLGTSEMIADPSHSVTLSPVNPKQTGLTSEERQALKKAKAALAMARKSTNQGSIQQIEPSATIDPQSETQSLNEEILGGGSAVLTITENFGDGNDGAQTSPPMPNTSPPISAACFFIEHKFSNRGA